MSLRLEFMALALNENANISRPCRRYGISSKRGFPPRLGFDKLNQRREPRRYPKIIRECSPHPSFSTAAATKIPTTVVLGRVIPPPVTPGELRGEAITIGTYRSKAFSRPYVVGLLGGVGGLDNFGIEEEVLIRIADIL
ncbi:MAG: hypothetical protein A2Z14_17930 [Chloroflexi bacterium RBG_16_48_8]|nr:MAG: hypothetical protein A2Z14_17930 [Chloroflexi bacterium RBG_16_48_8]